MPSVPAAALQPYLSVFLFRLPPSHVHARDAHARHLSCIVTHRVTRVVVRFLCCGRRGAFSFAFEFFLFFYFYYRWYRWIVMRGRRAVVILLGGSRSRGAGVGDRFSRSANFFQSPERATKSRPTHLKRTRSCVARYIAGQTVNIHSSSSTPHRQGRNEREGGR